MGLSPEIIKEYEESSPVEKKLPPIHKLRDAILTEFPELNKCFKVDIRLLWANSDGKIRYRVNGWAEDKVLFSKFIVAWMDNGLKYEIK